MELKFNVGDRVTKHSGYAFPGTVVSAFWTTDIKDRYVVEMDGYGLLHIFNSEQLRVMTDKEKEQSLRRFKAKNDDWINDIKMPKPRIHKGPDDATCVSCEG